MFHGQRQIDGDGRSLAFVKHDFGVTQDSDISRIALNLGFDDDEVTGGIVAA